MCRPLLRIRWRSPIRARRKRSWRPSSTAAKTSIPEMFRRLLDTLYSTRHNDERLRHFIYYIDRHIELDGDSHGPMGRAVLQDLTAKSPHRGERDRRAACSSIEARVA